MYTFLIALALVLPQDIATYPVVNEVFYDTPGDDTDEEWVELYNPTGSVIDISDYKVGDEETEGEGEGMYEFPDGTYFAADTFITICQYDTTFFRMYGYHCDFEFKDSDGSAANDMIKYSSWATGSMGLSNSGDEVLLFDEGDNAVDVVTYEGGSYPGVTPHPGVSTGHSIERSPPGEDTDDCSVDMVDRSSPDPHVGGAARAPTIVSVWRDPFCPDASEGVTVYAEITDGSGLESETVRYSVNGGSYSGVSMSPANGDTFYGVIPGQADAAHVRFHVVAENDYGLTDTSDTEGYFAGLTPIDSLRPNDSNGVPLYLGHAIRVTGLVTVGSHTFEAASHIINLQNDGVGVVGKALLGLCPTVAVGDSITVCGSISYWMGQTRISCPVSEYFQIEQTDKREPDIYVREYTDFYDYVGDTMDYEGLLVGLINADSYSGNWGPPNSSFGVWLQEFGASPPDTVEMWVDSDTDIDNSPEPSWPVDVVGVYSQYDDISGDGYWSGYEIMPRSIADFDYDLPVQLIGFSAASSMGAVLLSWETASEKDAYLYEIRRSYAASIGCDHAEVIGEVQAGGNSSTPKTYSFTDTQVEPEEIYYYWLVGITTGGQRTITGPVVAATGSAVVSISTPSPNPFYHNVVFFLSTAYETPVRVSVYDITGRRVRTLFTSDHFRGERVISWDGCDKSGRESGAGVYFIRNQVGGQEVTKKVLLMR